jgi:hypothetical protein
MGSLYPDELDRFADWVSTVDDCVTADLADLFDAIIQVEAELGLQPSAGFGTIHGRIFAPGNVSTKGGGWRMLEIKQSQGSGIEYSADSGGVLLTFDGSKYKGRDTAWGDDTPAVFVSYRFPLTTGFGSGPFFGYLGTVWNPIIHRLTVAVGQVFIGGREVDHSFVAAPDIVAKSFCNVLVWGLRT